MARDRDRSKTPPEQPASPDESTDALTEDTEDFTATVAAETVPFTESADKPNPLEPAYVHSRDNATGEGKDAKGVQMRVPGDTERVFATEDRAKKALALVRQAAGKHNAGARTRIRPETKNGTEGFALYFAWKPASQRNYTAADVRKWAAENGVEVPDKGRVPKSITTQYRAAHGLPVQEDKTPDAPPAE
jgi:hypothetical protein